MAQPTVFGHGLSVLESISAVAERYFFSDIRFSTGGDAGMSFCNLAFGLAICPFLCHFLVRSLFNYNSLILEFLIIGTIGKSFIAFWVLTCHCIVNCIPILAGHVMEVDLNKRLFLDDSSVAMQTLVQIHREFQTASDERFFHSDTISLVKSRITRGMQLVYVHFLFEQLSNLGVSASMFGRIAQGLQFGRILRSWCLACQQRWSDCVPWLPNRSRTLTGASRYMSGWWSREFRRSACWSHMFGDVWSSRQFSHLVAWNFWVILQCQVINFQSIMHEFSSIVLSGAASFRSAVGKISYPAPGLFKFCLVAQKILGRCTSFQRWPIMFFFMVRLADGTDLELYCMESESECLPSRSHLSSRDKVPISWLVPFVCSALCLIFTWVFRKWWKFIQSPPLFDGADETMVGAIFDRINAENNSLRREISLLDGQVSELSSAVRRLRECLHEVYSDHEKLAEQVDGHHVGIVRLGGLNPFQGLSIDQRQQVFARERRNMMAYRAMGPDRFMSTVLHQDMSLGLQSDFSVIGGVGARLDYPRGESPAENLPLIEFNDVGDGSGLPQDVLWAIARNKLQIELYNCLVREDFSTARLFQQMLLFFIDVSHQDRTLDRRDQEHLFTGLGNRLESLSEELRREDEARAEYYLALAGRFRGVVLPRTTWVV